jgi:hypothetical protein
MFQIINSRTKEVVGQRTTRKAASRLVDKLDNQYGAYVHTIVWSGPNVPTTQNKA